MISSQVDDVILAGSDAFLEEITQKIAKTIKISKLNNNEFIFTAMDVKKGR